MNPTIETLCEQFCNRMMEHADSVRVFVTWREDGCTDEYTEGDGNLLAQERQVQKFLMEQNELVMKRIREGGDDDYERTH